MVRFEARRLRRDLDSYYIDDGRQDPVRITIPKGGYVPHFRWHPVPTDAPSSDDSGRQARDATVAGSTGQAATADETLAGAFAWPQWSPPRPPHRQRVDWLSGFAPSTEEVVGPAIIVLPFETLSDDEEDHNLASGVTYEVITDLMRFEHFRVYSVPASFRLDPQADPQALGRDLGVAYVVKGALSSEGDQVRLLAQLYDATSGRIVWSDSYDRSLTPGALLEVQEELAASVATVLGEPYGRCAATLPSGPRPGRRRACRATPASSGPTTTDAASTKSSTSRCSTA